MRAALLAGGGGRKQDEREKTLSVMGEGRRESWEVERKETASRFVQNQKFIQSCSGSLRLATTVRSPPLSTPLASTLAIRYQAAVLLSNYTAQSRDTIRRVEGAYWQISGERMMVREEERERCSGNRVGYVFQRWLFSSSN
ncbi:hypothetical protein PAMP_013972 [Pampus punctatissimus]